MTLLPSTRRSLGLALLLAIACQPALAQDLSPVTDMLGTVVTAVTGPLGRGVAIIAVIAAGFASFTGRINWAWFVMILVGTVLVFNADTIVDGFGT